MGCLENTVGIWDEVSDKDPNIIYINDLPGFDLSFPDFLAPKQVSDGIELLENKRRSASLFLKQEILQHLNPRTTMGSVLANQVSGTIQENLQVKTLEAAKYKGLQLSLGQYPYLSIYVDRISVFAVNAVTTNVLVVDLQQGIVLDTLPITTVAGEITYIQVGKEYKNEGQYLNLAFLIDSSLTDVYYVTADRAICSGCFARMEHLNTFTDGRGVSISQAAQQIDSNLVSEIHTNGISVHYSIQCNHDHFLCNMANRFMTSMFYRFGIELMDEVIHSARLTSLTTIGKDKARELKAELITKYNNTMEGVLQNLELPNNVCYHCKPMVQIVNRIP
jgi:hypothetical protein